MSGYDSENRNVSSRVRKVVRDGADVTSGGRRCEIVNVLYSVTLLFTGWTHVRIANGCGCAVVC